MDKCPEYPKCQDRRMADAEFKGKVEAKLDGIETQIKNLTEGVWAAMEVNRKDIKNLYYKVGGIAAGSSLIIVVIVKIVWR